eukprot:scaffold1397_cov254-Pinguiococcus_pyrenoidosus.AAC.42
MPSRVSPKAPELSAGLPLAAAEVDSSPFCRTSLYTFAQPSLSFGEMFSVSIAGPKRKYARSGPVGFGKAMGGTNRLNRAASSSSTARSPASFIVGRGELAFVGIQDVVEAIGGANCTEGHDGGVESARKPDKVQLRRPEELVRFIPAVIDLPHAAWEEQHGFALLQQLVEVSRGHFDGSKTLAGLALPPAVCSVARSGRLSRLPEGSAAGQLESACEMTSSWCSLIRRPPGGRGPAGSGHDPRETHREASQGQVQRVGGSPRKGSVCRRFACPARRSSPAGRSRDSLGLRT